MRMTTLCYIEKDGKYLMLHRVKKKNDISHDKWIGVGGHGEYGESPEECLLREVREETGLMLISYQFRGLIIFVSNQCEPDSFEGELTDGCNEGELEWVDKEKVLALPTWEGDHLFLELLLDGEKRFFTIKCVYENDRLIENEIAFY